MMSSSTYRHFGLTIASEWPLPLENANVGPDGVDVRIRRGSVHLSGRLAWQSQVGPPSAYYEGTDAHIVDMGSARFAVSKDQITVDAEDGDMSTQLLLFHVWAAVMALRGREPLHGAVVERDGRGLAIFGSSGSGKTTGSLLLIDQGWRLVTDDLIAFDDAGKVLPGPPFMRLRADRAIGRNSRPDGAGKHRLVPPRAAEPVGLAAAVVLTTEVSQLRRLSSTEAVEALLTTPYNVFPTDPAQALNWLRTSLDIARRIPIYGAPIRSLTTEQLLTVAGN